MRIKKPEVLLFLIAAICLGAVVIPPVDRGSICALVLEDHLRSRSFPAVTPTPHFGVYFVNVDSSSESNLLWTAFKTNWPTVVIGTNRLWIPKGAPYLDRLTGLNAQVFNAKVISYEFPNAKARSIASFGNTGAEAFIYTLLHTNGQWTIVKKQHDGYALQNRPPGSNLAAR